MSNYGCDCRSNRDSVLVVSPSLPAPFCPIVHMACRSCAESGDTDSFAAENDCREG